MTILLVTHNVQLAARADRRLRLLDGLVQAA
jgi:predicted ABC-type transport system involved in lysophospholipase L1 biosynthesis ATPase subunit